MPSELLDPGKFKEKLQVSLLFLVSFDGYLREVRQDRREKASGEIATVAEKLGWRVLWACMTIYVGIPCRWTRRSSVSMFARRLLKTTSDWLATRTGS